MLRPKPLISDRRFIICLVSLALLFILGYVKNVPVAEAMAWVAIGLTASNASAEAFRHFSKRKPTKKKGE